MSSNFNLYELIKFASKRLEPIAGGHLPRSHRSRLDYTYGVIYRAADFERNSMPKKTTNFELQRRKSIGSPRQGLNNGAKHSNNCESNVLLKASVRVRLSR